jgi:hypothetical protein
MGRAGPLLLLLLQALRVVPLLVRRFGTSPEGKDLPSSAEFVRSIERTGPLLGGRSGVRAGARRAGKTPFARRSAGKKGGARASSCL